MVVPLTPLSRRQKTILQGDKEFNAKLGLLVRLGSNLSPVFETIISDFYKSNKAIIFNLHPGKYLDLKDSTKKQKKDSKRSIAKPYPILTFSGRLRDSLTRRTDQDAIVINRPKELILGTSVKYAGYLQLGTKKMKRPNPPITGRRAFGETWRMPPRPFLLIDTTPDPRFPNSGRYAENFPDSSGKNLFNARKGRWLRIIDTAIKSILKGKK